MLSRPGHRNNMAPLMCNDYRSHVDLDVAPYHDRQVMVLDRADWARWLDPGVSAKDLLKPLPAESLKVEQVA